MATTYVGGKYVAEVLDHGFTTSAAKGTPGFFMQLKILGRYDGQGKIQECPQYERTYTQWLANETGFNILKADLKTLGVEITELKQLDRSFPGHVSLIGRQIDVTCDIEAYQGKQQERWGVARAIKKMEQTAVIALSEQFRQLLSGQKAKGSEPGVDAAKDTGPTK